MQGHGGRLGLVLLISMGLATFSAAEPDKLYLDSGPSDSPRLGLQQQACWFKGEPHWPKAECGVLWVPENYQQPQQARLSLPYIIFKAFHPQANKFPLLVTGGGGPGNGLGIDPEATEPLHESVWNDWYSSTVTAGRDLILIDNRGAGSSRPRLNCPELENFELSALGRDFKAGEYRQQYTWQTESCRQRLLAQGVDIQQYHIDNAARDLEQLRLGLQLKRWNLYGVSYGSRLAQRYQQLFPQPSRSLVLDGVYPLHIDAFAGVNQRDLATWKLVFSLCRRRELCRLRFGLDLQSRFENYLKKLEPSTVMVEYNGRQIPLRLNAELIITAFWNAAYQKEVIQQLPLVAHTVLEGQPELLLDLIVDEVVTNLGEYSLDEAAYASYACYDENPFAKISLTTAKDHFITAKLNTEYLQIESKLCSYWQLPPGPSQLKNKTAVTAPVLLLSAELDNATPPQWAESLAKLSPIAWSKTWSNMSHHVLAQSYCADEYIGRFLDKPKQSPFAYACTDSSEKFKFQLYP